VLIGDANVGKTTFLTRHLTGAFKKVHEATHGVDNHSLLFYTNHGPIKFDVSDTAGEENYAGLGDGYYIDAKCAIIMFDVTNCSTCKNVADWYRGLTRLAENIPIVVVGNKADMKRQRQVTEKDKAFLRKKNLQYYEVSAKTTVDFEKPFLYLARKLLDKDDLEIVGAPALQPPEAIIDDETKAKNEAEIAKAAAMPLPDEGDENEENEG
jgi:GTP-binding nuclear protein Ran